MKLYPGPRGFSLNFSSPKERERAAKRRGKRRKLQGKPLGQGSEAIFYLKNLKFTGLEILLSLFRL